MELKELLEKQNQAFSEFKEANGKRLKALEALTKHGGPPSKAAAVAWRAFDIRFVLPSGVLVLKDIGGMLRRGLGLHQPPADAATRAIVMHHRQGMMISLLESAGRRDRRGVGRSVQGH